ncbi:MAG: sulfatase-like hydrolase/transferase, partial [Myxococcota bacterium]|nr:sulfatase-like hydrolase/transferase [Myxococcota bacterium]
MLTFLPLLWACGDDAPRPVAPAERPPDVLLVVLDTVRADALSTYGNPRPTSPQLSAIADAGVRFADVTAEGSWTWPSHATLFTGLPPWEHGAHLAPPDEGGVQVGPDPFHASAMRSDVPTLAERFSAAGYRTVSISANRLVAPDFGLTRGFGAASNPADDAAVVAAATAALAVPDERPLLLFVNLYGAHAPFDVQPVSWLRTHPLLQLESQPPWLAPYLTQEGARLNYFLQPEGASRIGIFAYMRGELQIPAEGLSLLKDVYEGEVSAVD